MPCSVAKPCVIEASTINPRCISASLHLCICSVFWETGHGNRSNTEKSSKDIHRPDFLGAQVVAAAAYLCIIYIRDFHLHFSSAEAQVYAQA
jgi:hypothetical protein